MAIATRRMRGFLLKRRISVPLERFKSSLALIAGVFVILAAASVAQAHETSPAIADITVTADDVTLEIILQAESLVAGIDLSAVTDTNDAPEATTYDQLRALAPPEFAAEFRSGWETLADGFDLRAGAAPLPITLQAFETTDEVSPELPRQSRLTITAALPNDGTAVSFGWDKTFGPLILRQIAPDLPADQDAYSAFLANGERSADIPRQGAPDISLIETVFQYIIIGFEHIIPKGLDHILFVLGLFFFSTKMRPLLYQISLFTLAHTATLALATLGLIKISAHIIEPLIALSIAYVAIENILRPKLSPVRLVVIFCFGLLHGLGFASVLGDIGLSSGHFVSSLIAFNIGVELGQLAVVALAFSLVAYWFGEKAWYRSVVVIPVSTFIGLVGLWWAVERVIL